uniref:Uncharacterized protein n=1 Tax=viral metagenome TaxID=1070528 RepID=A0A6H1ZKC0_9ZZZZ
MPAGRPAIIDENTLQILEGAFSNGATDLEACFLAKISKSTLYNYQEINPEFVERKKALKDMVKYQAKQVIVKSIKEGDKQQANWWLERKAKDEGFSPRQEVSGPEGVDLGFIYYPKKDDSQKDTTKSSLETTSEAGDSIDNRS